MEKSILVEVSAKHIHLSERDMKFLFGKDFTLKKERDLSQPGQFASKEKIDIQIGKNILKGVRVVGPTRENTQVELSITDAVKLGVDPPIRMSGDLRSSLGVTLIKGSKRRRIKEGLIVAARHIHCNSKEAKSLKLKNKQKVLVEIKGQRPLVFHDVKVRIHDDYKLSMHIDTDEANAVNISMKGRGLLKT